MDGLFQERFQNFKNLNFWEQPDDKTLNKEDTPIFRIHDKMLRFLKRGVDVKLKNEEVSECFMIIDA